jgi:hypothetical protein
MMSVPCSLAGHARPARSLSAKQAPATIHAPRGGPSRRPDSPPKSLPAPVETGARPARALPNRPQSRKINPSEPAAKPENYHRKTRTKPPLCRFKIFYINIDVKVS